MLVSIVNCAGGARNSFGDGDPNYGQIIDATSLTFMSHVYNSSPLGTHLLENFKQYN